MEEGRRLGDAPPWIVFMVLQFGLRECLGYALFWRLIACDGSLSGLAVGGLMIEIVQIYDYNQPGSEV